MSWTGAYGVHGSPPVPTQRRHTGNLVFTVVVSLALLGGAVVMALVLANAGAPTAIVVGLVLAAVPVGPLVACYLWLDRYEPEPLWLLVVAFLWGALVATAAALVLQVADQLLNGPSRLWSGAVVAPVTEEAAKGLFVLLLLWARRRDIDGVLDGLVYAGLVGVGFAFSENILYFASAYMGGEDVGPGGLGAATGLFVVRGIFSPFAHPLFTSAFGIGVGIAVGTRRRTVRVVAPLVGYVVAVTLHAAWNGSAFLGGRLFIATYLVAMIPFLLVVVGLAVWMRGREGVMLGRSLEDLAARGVLGRHEVPWLARIPARHASRRFAATHGGPLAERAMRDYQQLAVELAYLHSRYLRGSAPPDLGQRGRHLAGELAALRPWVMFPQVSGSGWPRPSEQTGR